MTTAKEHMYRSGRVPGPPGFQFVTSGFSYDNVQAKSNQTQRKQNTPSLRIDSQVFIHLVFNIAYLYLLYTWYFAGYEMIKKGKILEPEGSTCPQVLWHV